MTHAFVAIWLFIAVLCLGFASAGAETAVDVICALVAALAALTLAAMEIEHRKKR